MLKNQENGEAEKGQRRRRRGVKKISLIVENLIRTIFVF